MVAGYSGTPLSKKLGISAGARVRVLNPPPDYQRLLEPLPADVRFGAGDRPKPDLVHIFVVDRAELGPALVDLRKNTDPAVPVWVSWPKKSAKVPTTVTEDVIRELALPLGYVDIKVCAVSAIWSGLKLVVRKELR